MRGLTLIALAALAAPLGAQSADATIDRAVTAYATLKTARGSFEQTLTNPLTKSVMRSRGVFQQEMPSTLSVVFTDLKDDRLVADGKALWLYLPSTNPGVAIKLPLGSGVGGSVDLLGQFVSSPRTRYAITPLGKESVGGRATTMLKLVPKRPMDEFKQATIWVDDANGRIQQFEVTEATGLVRRIHFLTFQSNVAVDRNAFTFTVPPNVRVLDQTRPGAAPGGVRR
jgi:outer membrane lipoprotein carrier protein